MLEAINGPTPSSTLRRSATSPSAPNLKTRPVAGSSFASELTCVGVTADVLESLWIEAPWSPAHRRHAGSRHRGQLVGRLAGFHPSHERIDERGLGTPLAIGHRRICAGHQRGAMVEPGAEVEARDRLCCGVATQARDDALVVVDR